MNRNTQIPSLPMNKQQQRLYPAALDPTFEHETYEDMKSYLNNATAYLGQVLYCKANDKHYKIAKGENSQKKLEQFDAMNMTEYDTKINKISEQVGNIERNVDEHIKNCSGGGSASNQNLNIYVTPQMFGAKADGRTDDTKAIQDAIDHAKTKGINRVFVPAGTYVVTTIIIPEFFTFEGVSRYSTKLKQDNSATSDIIKFKQSACFSIVKNMKLESAYDTSKPVRHGICITDYVDGTGYFDSCNAVENVYISDVTGDGVYVGWNQRGVRLETIDVTRCNKAGIRVHGSDNVLFNCAASVCREADFMNDWGGWNNRYIGCKGFHAGVDNTATNVDKEMYMMWILGNYNNIFSDVQESVGGGLRVQGNGNKIDLMIDGCGKKSYENGAETTIIKLDEGSKGNNVRAIIGDGTLDGYSKYMLDISNKAFNNNIDITFSQGGDIEKRKDIQLTKSPYHFSNTVRLNGVSYLPIIYNDSHFTKVTANDGVNIINNITKEGNSYSATINKSIASLDPNSWMYMMFSNEFNNKLVQEAKKHNNGRLHLQFDFNTNVKLSDDYFIDVIVWGGSTMTTDVFQRTKEAGTIYMDIPCQIAEGATEYVIAVGIRKTTQHTTVQQPATTMMKISKIQIGFGDYIEDRDLLSYTTADMIPQDDVLVTTPIIGNTLNLTTNKYQKATMKNNTNIVLPTVNNFTEIHLRFKTTEALTLSLPNIKWQNQPTIEANKTYEFIFTYDDEWTGGVITYA